MFVFRDVKVTNKQQDTTKKILQTIETLPKLEENKSDEVNDKGKETDEENIEEERNENNEEENPDNEAENKENEGRRKKVEKETNSF